MRPRGPSRTTWWATSHSRWTDNPRQFQSGAPHGAPFVFSGAGQRPPISPPAGCRTGYNQAHPTAPGETAPMLKLDGVTKRFRGGVTAVADLSLELGCRRPRPARPNGAGKTTLMQMIATVTRPTAGRIFFRASTSRASPTSCAAASATCRRTSASTTTSPRSSSSATSPRSRACAKTRAHPRDAGDGEPAQRRAPPRRRVLRRHEAAPRHRPGADQRSRLCVIVDEPTAGLDPEERVRFRNVSRTSARGGWSSSPRTSSPTSSRSPARSRSCSTEAGDVCRARDTPSGGPRSVWEARVSSSDYEAAKGRLKVTRAVRQADGVHTRIVAREQPFPAATGRRARPRGRIRAPHAVGGIVACHHCSGRSWASPAPTCGSGSAGRRRSG